MSNNNKQNLTVSVGTTSIIGTRNEQQDCAYVETNDVSTFAVVCDGMGGLNGGSLASQTAVSLLASHYDKLHPTHHLPTFFQQEANLLDQAVFNLKDEQGNPLHAGTTIVSTIIEHRNLYCLAIGDSRIYLIRNHTITAINRDHNYRLRLDTALQNGEITSEIYAQEESRADALISYIGMGKLALIDINQQPIPLFKEDIILLCSDGLYKALDHQNILNICSNKEVDAQAMSEQLINQAVIHSIDHLDNTTAIILKIK